MSLVIEILLTCFKSWIFSRLYLQQTILKLRNDLFILTVWSCSLSLLARTRPAIVESLDCWKAKKNNVQNPLIIKDYKTRTVYPTTEEKQNVSTRRQSSTVLHCIFTALLFSALILLHGARFLPLDRPCSGLAHPWCGSRWGRCYFSFAFLLPERVARSIGDYSFVSCKRIGYASRLLVDLVDHYAQLILHHALDDEECWWKD